MGVEDALTDDACLGILEILDIAAVEDLPPSHVLSCERCSALLEIARKEAPETPSARGFFGTTGVSRSVPQGTGGVGAGQLWRTVTPGASGLRKVVAIVGRQREPRGSFRVVPTSIDMEMATNLDLVVRDREILGYEFLLEVWNGGPMLADALEEHIGDVSATLMHDLLSLQEWIVAGGEEPRADTEQGTPLGSTDSRRSWRVEELHDAKQLWALARSHHSDGAEATASLGGFVRQCFDGNEWDERSLAEAAQADIDHVRALVADALDLSDASDAISIARVARALDLDEDVAVPLLRGTLSVSPGGLRTAKGEADTPIAARTHVTAQPVSADVVYSGMATLDTSNEARARLMDEYVDLFLEELAKP